MRKKVTQRLVSGVLCLAMGITLISPVTSRAAETSEPTTQATTESASTETTTENPVTTETSIETEAATNEVQAAPSEDVLFDHFFDTGILPATLQSKDFSSCELLVAADPIIFTKNTTVLSAYNGVYLLRFDSPEEAMYAYSYYYDKAEMIDINAVIFQTSDDEHYEEVQADLADLNQGDDALSEANALPDVDLKKNTIALVDTGCEGSNVNQSVSVLGGETKDDNGHGTRMHDFILEENPDAEILSIKALDKDGKAQVSDIYAAITYAVENGADIINLSISAMATKDSAIVEEAIKDAVSRGITVVGAAGNAGRDAKYYVPGKIGEAVIIGACDENGKKISISNFGNTVDYNVTASSTSEAAARFSGIISKDGMENISVNAGKVFTTDYEKTATESDAYVPETETTTETTTEETTEAGISDVTETTEAVSDTSETTEAATEVTTEEATDADADNKKWDISDKITDIIDGMFYVQQDSCAGYVSNRLGLSPKIENVHILRPYLLSHGWYIKSEGGDYDTSTVQGCNALSSAINKNAAKGDIVIFYSTIRNGYDNVDAMSHIGIINTVGGFGETEDLGFYTYPTYDYDSTDSSPVRIGKSIARYVHYASGSKSSRGYEILSRRYGTLRVVKSIEGNQTWSNATDISGASYGVFGSAEDARNKTNALGYCVVKPSALVNGIAFNNLTTYINSDINGNGSDVWLRTDRSYYVREVQKPTSGYWKEDEVVYGPFNLENWNNGNIDTQNILLTIGQNPINYDGTSVTVSGETNSTLIGPEKIDAPGSMTLKKTCLNTTPDDYSYTGCTYEVYMVESDQATTGTLVGRFACGADGTGIVTYSAKNSADVNTTTLTHLQCGIYMIKEIKGNEYFAVNSQPVYQNITVDNTVCAVSVNDSAIYSYVTLKKSASNAECVTGSPLYSLVGTTYQIYADAGCTNKAQAIVRNANGDFTGYEEAVLKVVDETGNTNTLSLRPGVYYCKETAAGKGYKVNSQAQRFVVTEANTSGNPYIINATDEPILDPVRIELNKIDSEGIVIDPADVGGATLEGAVFKVAYYSDYYDKDTYKSKNPERVWYIQTKYNATAKVYECQLNSQFLAPGYNSSDIYYDNNGQPQFPLGTVVITEEKASNGYKIDESSMTVAGQKCDKEVFIGQVIQNGDEAAMYIDDGTGSYTTNAENETIKVNNKAADGSDLAISEQVKRTDVSFVKVNYETGVEMADIFFKITSSTGEAHYVKTGTKGDFVSTKVPHSQYTNYYDRLFDDDKENDYIDVNGTKTYIGDLDCGLWFFGTDDQSEWKKDKVKDDKGALRYDDNYVLTEEVGKNNKGYQMIVPMEFAASVENNTQFLGVISNVPTPSIKTQEWDKDTKTHVSIFREGEVNNIMDTVTYKYLTAGEKYTYKGILMELDENGKLKGPMLDVDGNYIRANKQFTVDTAYVKTKQEKCGSEDVEFTFTGTDLKNKKFVIFEYLFAGTSDELIPVNEDGTVDETGVLEFKVDNSDDESIPDKITVKHTDETDINQIGLFPDIETEAFATETEDNMLLLSDSMKISDKVYYNGLNTGIDYKVKSWIMYEDIRDGKEYAIKDKDGNDLELVTPYTAEGQSGTIKVNLPEFDGTQLLDEDGKMITKGVTVYEEISLNGVVYASETDINNKKQTVYIPQIGTTATDKETGLQVVNAGKVTITDKISFDGLVTGQTYDFVGTVVNQRTGEIRKNADGSEVKSEKSYVATTESGVTYMDFTFEAEAGETYVIFEDIYHNGVKIATHASLDSKPQTIWVPKITTTLREGETGSKNVLYTDDVFLIDEVSYENLPDGEYIMRGTPMNKDTEKALAEGEKEITTDQPFTVKDGAGQVNVEFHFDATKTDLIKKDGSLSPITCFEEVIVDAHIDEEGHYETVTIPAYDEEVSQTKYFCLDCSSSFDTEEQAKAHCDEKAHENYEAKEIVIDTIHHDAETKEQYVKDHDAMDVNTVVAEEKSIDNVDQTVTPPEIHTTATDGVTGTHVGVVGDKTSIDDVVKHKGLIPGREYEFTGRLYIQPEEMIGTAIYKDENGNIYINGEYVENAEIAPDADVIELEPLKDENGVPVTATTKAVVEEADGEIVVHFEFSSALLAGKTVTCFEDVYYNGKKVCTHSDITDSSQSVKYPSCHTTATNAADGTHIAKPDEVVTIEDRVYYENLIPGEEYTARGSLQDYDAKSMIMIDGKETVGDVTFIAESESGYADVKITLNASSLANKTTVVFEDIYYKGVIVCSHRDYESTEQTIVFTDQPQTGDILLWVFAGLGTVGLFGIAAVFFKKKK